MNSTDFFETATGGNSPYTCRLACGERARPDDDSTLVCGTDCRSQLIDIPTGLGKTAAVVLARLWNRMSLPRLDGQPALAAHSAVPARIAPRARLPHVFLEPYTDTCRDAYFAVLEAAYRDGVQPLTDIWRDRLVHVETPENETF